MLSCPVGMFGITSDGVAAFSNVVLFFWSSIAGASPAGVLYRDQYISCTSIHYLKSNYHIYDREVTIPVRGCGLRQYSQLQLVLSLTSPNFPNSPSAFHPPFQRKVFYEKRTSAPGPQHPLLPQALCLRPIRPPLLSWLLRAYRRQQTVRPILAPV